MAIHFSLYIFSFVIYLFYAVIAKITHAVDMAETFPKMPKLLSRYASSFQRTIRTDYELGFFSELEASN